MEVNRITFLKEKISEVWSRCTNLFFKKTEASEKPEVNWGSIKVLSLISVLLFIGVVLLLPSEQTIEFSTKSAQEIERQNHSDDDHLGSSKTKNPNSVWASPKMNYPSVSNAPEVNHNTSMLLGSSQSGNAKTQLRPGLRLPLRILDKFIVSDSPVPILAELILTTETESGLALKAGTRFYGEASFSRGQSRAQVRFTQISLPNGEIRSITGIALGKDGQPGIDGKIFSDGVKNTTGQIITTFVAGLAAGSVETDAFGASKGGLQNGLLSAISATAKERAQGFGEKLKIEREWIEVSQGAECDAILSQSLNLQMGGAQ